MVTLSTAHDYLVMFAIAAGLGALGGVAYELGQTRDKKTGLVLVPSYDGEKHYLEAGVAGSMFIGAVAAVAISYFFTPEVAVKTVVHGVSDVQTKWQIVKVVALSLIVGSSGRAILDAMQARVLARLNAQKLDTTKKVSKAQVDHLGRLAKNHADLLASGAANHAATGARSTLAGAGVKKLTLSMLDSHAAGVQDAVSSGLAATVAETKSAIDESVRAANETIEAAASDD